MFEDLLQRIYTDDGHGDGRVTPEGLDVLDSLSGHHVCRCRICPERYTISDTATTTLAAAVYFMGPGVAAHDRRPAREQEMYDSLFDEAIQRIRGRPGSGTSSRLAGRAMRLMELTRDEPGKLRICPVALLLIRRVSPMLRRGRTDKADCETRLRWPLRLVIWKKEHGAWPKSLDELVPDLLAGRAAGSIGWPAVAICVARRQADRVFDRQRP